MQEEIKQIVIAYDDGTVIDTVKENQSYAILEKGDKVTRRNSIKHLSDTVKIGNAFIKVNDVALSFFDKDILPACKLFQYVSYQDGKIEWNNGRAIKTSTDIAKICGISTSTSKKMVNKLVQEDIIHKHKRTKDSRSFYYTMNPFICLRGSRALVDLFEEFKNSKWRWINTNE